MAFSTTPAPSLPHQSTSQPQPQLGAVQNGAVPLQRVAIYACQRWLYLVGLCRVSRRYAVLRLSREFHGAVLQVKEEPGRLTQAEVNALLRSLHEAQARTGSSLQLVAQAHGIIGCFRFTDTYYLMLISRKSYVGSMCGHKVYKIDAVALLPLAAAGGGPAGLKPQYEEVSEKRYRKLLMGVDLTKNFYFSYTYCLADTLQANCHPSPAAAEARWPAGRHAAARPGGSAGGLTNGHGGANSGWGQRQGVFDSMFVWNSHLAAALRAAVGHDGWVVPLIHGYWEQCQVSVFGRPLTITLLARRSRHFAGTRYRKRGITNTGRVANEVEVEQVVDAGHDWRTRLPLLSSLVQLRGSVPLFWSQTTSALSPKPGIVLQQFDPLYEATALHFSDLRLRYGGPPVVLNLLKSRERHPRETLLRRGLAQAVGVLNAQLRRALCVTFVEPLFIDGVASMRHSSHLRAPPGLQVSVPRERTVYIPFDVSKAAKQGRDANLLLKMAGITGLALDCTGFFVHRPGVPAPCPAQVDAGGSAQSQRGGDGQDVPRVMGVIGASTSGMHPPSTASTSNQEAGGSSSSSSSIVHGSKGACGSASERGQARGEGAGGCPLQHAEHLGRSSRQGGSAGMPAADDLRDAHTSHRNRGGRVAGISGGGWPGGGPAATGPEPFQLQRGIVRTNCIDCLDRTNVAQFAIGLMAFSRQLYHLGISDSPDSDQDSSIAFVLMGMYEAMGDTLALQYGGSEAHSVFFQRRKGEWEAATHGKDLVTSMRRMYSNAYTDAEKQDAMNLFLGNFVPQPGQPALWELDTDYYLHAASWAPPAAAGAAAATSSLSGAGGPAGTASQTSSTQQQQQKGGQRSLASDSVAIPGSKRGSGSTLRPAPPGMGSKSGPATPSGGCACVSLTANTQGTTPSVVSIGSLVPQATDTPVGGMGTGPAAPAASSETGAFSLRMPDRVGSHCIPGVGTPPRLPQVPPVNIAVVAAELAASLSASTDVQPCWSSPDVSQALLRSTSARHQGERQTMSSMPSLSSSDDELVSQLNSSCDLTGCNPHAGDTGPTHSTGGGSGRGTRKAGVQSNSSSSNSREKASLGSSSATGGGTAQHGSTQASGVWGLLSLLTGAQRRSRGPVEQRNLSSDDLHQLVSFDVMLSRGPRKIGNVRLYGSRCGGQPSHVWSAVQHAFTFYTANNPAAAAPGAAASAAGKAAAAAAAVAAAATAAALEAQAAADNIGLMGTEELLSAPAATGLQHSLLTPAWHSQPSGLSQLDSHSCAQRCPLLQTHHSGMRPEAQSPMRASPEALPPPCLGSHAGTAEVLNALQQQEQKAVPAAAPAGFMWGYAQRLSPAKLLSSISFAGGSAATPPSHKRTGAGLQYTVGRGSSWLEHRHGASQDGTPGLCTATSLQHRASMMEVHGGTIASSREVIDREMLLLDAWCGGGPGGLSQSAGHTSAAAAEVEPQQSSMHDQLGAPGRTHGSTGLVHEPPGNMHWYGHGEVEEGGGEDPLAEAGRDEAAAAALNARLRGDGVLEELLTTEVNDLGLQPEVLPWWEQALCSQHLSHSAVHPDTPAAAAGVLHLHPAAQSKLTGPCKARSGCLGGCDQEAAWRQWGVAYMQRLNTYRRYDAVLLSCLIFASPGQQQLLVQYTADSHVW